MCVIIDQHLYFSVWNIAVSSYSDSPRSSATISTICGCGAADDVGFGVSGVEKLDTITTTEVITSSTRQMVMVMVDFIVLVTQTNYGPVSYLVMSFN